MSEETGEIGAGNLYKKMSAERKEYQKQDLIPQWYSTAAYQTFKQKYEYDTNGRSVRAQFERIAKTAAKHLKGTKWEAEAEQQFFDLLWEGDLGPSSPVMSNMGTERGLPVSCFEAGTLVNTESGQKAIEELQIGDKVWTHTGSLKEVTATMSRESADIFELEFEGETYFVTGDHLVMTQDGWVRVDQLDSDVHSLIKLV